VVNEVSPCATDIIDPHRQQQQQESSSSLGFDPVDRDGNSAASSSGGGAADPRSTNGGFVPGLRLSTTTPRGFNLREVGGCM